MGVPTETDRLRIAFSVHVTKMIIEADGVIDYGEMQLLGRLYPSAMLEACGFMNDRGGFTEVFDTYRRRALDELPGSLAESEKLTILTSFYETTVADGALDPNEVTVLQEAADLLGVSRRRLQLHLDQVTMGRGTAPPTSHR